MTLRTEDIFGWSSREVALEKRLKREREEKGDRIKERKCLTVETGFCSFWQVRPM
jgi:hypothetical protein